MDFIKDLLAYIPSIEELIQMGGIPVLVAIVFVETGLLVGFFLPGDSLLVTAGIFAANDVISLWPLLIYTTIAAIVGDAVGYLIGRKAGEKLYAREDSRFFKRRHLEKTREFYEKHGGKTIILARFIPIIRTFAPTVAGAAGMSYRRFAMFNVIGGIGWVWSMIWTGYALFKVMPNAKDYLHYIIAVVVFLSILPPIFEWWRERRKTQAAAAAAAGR
jgi:membrane-associated protein